MISWMRRDPSLPPWPGLRQTWWVFLSAAAILGLYCIGFVLRIRCRFVGHCGGTASRFFDLDAVGGLPRLAVAVMFVVTAALAYRAYRRTSGRPALWWGTLAAGAAVLALFKLVSAHSIVKGVSAVLTLAVSVLLAVAGLTALWIAGRRWRIRATGPVVLALAFYAVTAIGLDAVTSLVAAVQSDAGALTAAASTFVEELGEALTAMGVLVTVRWQAAAAGPASGGPADAHPAPGLRPHERVSESA
jgi:hypothetical protein